MRILFLSSVLISVLAGLVFWCPVLGEHFHSGMDNAQPWAVTALTVGTVAAMAGGSFLRAGALVFLVVNALLGALLSFFAVIGEIPAGFVSLDVDRPITGTVAVALLGMAAAQRFIWKNVHRDAPGARVQAARIGHVFSFLIFAAVTAFTVYIYSGWTAARDTSANHQRLANQLHELGRDGAALGEERLQILLRVTDPNFLRHNGMDSLTPCARTQTLTQMAVWRLAGKPKEHPFGKFWHAGYALGLESQLSKEAILALFLNQVYMGSATPRDLTPVIGFFEGSEFFFGKPPAELSRPDYISLVAIMASGGSLSHTFFKERLDEQVLRIERMLAGECEPSYNGDPNLYKCDSSLFGEPIGVR